MRYKVLYRKLKVRYNVRYMGKLDSKPTSYRFRDEVRFALDELAERWGCKKTAALERTVLAAHAVLFGRVGSGNTAEEGEAEAVIAPTEIPGVQVGVSLPKNARCAHCGQKFTGAKLATVCGPCGDSGHGGDTRECRACSERDGAI